MENNLIEFSTPNPSFVGGWYIGGRIGFGIMLQKKPNIIHRFFMKFLLGVEWFDNLKN
jgi:hypothetical protein